MTDISCDVKYQYKTSKGKELWIAFDPARPCIYCEEPVGSLSFGGALVCPSCDCGRHRDGRLWTMEEAFMLYKKAQRNVDALDR